MPPFALPEKSHKSPINQLVNKLRKEYFFIKKSRKRIIQDSEVAKSFVHTLHLSQCLPESTRNEQMIKEKEGWNQYNGDF